jgi:hypothetical protein
MLIVGMTIVAGGSAEFTEGRQRRLRVRLSAHDPVAGENFRRALGARAAKVAVPEDWRAAADPAEIVVVATEWPEYETLRTLDLGTKTVFDARRMFAPGELSCGRYLAIGR